MTCKKAIASLLFCFYFMMPLMANAQVVVTETQALSFGTFSFTDFNAVLSIEIQNNGSYTTNGNVAIISTPARGEFSMTSTHLNAVYTITSASSFTLPGSGGDFTIDNIRFLPASLITNGSGADDFQIAARLVSVGGGTNYNNGPYNNTFDITISF